jgi:hypothetical protein
VAARASGDRRIEAWALTNIGFAQNMVGDKRKAIDYLLRALPWMREVGDIAGAAATLNSLGRARAESGESRQALEHFAEAAKSRTTISANVIGRSRIMRRASRYFANWRTMPARRMC